MALRKIFKAKKDVRGGGRKITDRQPQGPLLAHSPKVIEV